MWLFVVVVIGNTRVVTIIIMKNRQIQIQKLFLFCFVVLAHAVVVKHRGLIYSSFSSVARLLLFDIYAPLFSVELVLESSNSVFFTPTITLFVAFVVPLRAAIPALGAFLINVFAAAFAPPP